MALIPSSYCGLPDLSRKYDIDLRALTRMAERHEAIRAIRIGSRLFIDMAAAQREAVAKGLELSGFFKTCARQSKR